MLLIKFRVKYPLRGNSSGWFFRRFFQETAVFSRNRGFLEVFSRNHGFLEKTEVFSRNRSFLEVFSKHRGFLAKTEVFSKQRGFLEVFSKYWGLTYPPPASILRPILRCPATPMATTTILPWSTAVVIYHGFNLSEGVGLGPLLQSGQIQGRQQLTLPKVAEQGHFCGKSETYAENDQKG